MFNPPAIDWNEFGEKLHERYDGAVKPVLSTDVQVDATQWDYSIGDSIDGAIDQIIGAAATPLEQFMAAARQAKAQASFDFFTRAEDINDQLRIEYTWNSGHESALLIVRPSNGGGQPQPQQIDSNFDGYVAVFFTPNSQGGGANPIAVDVYMNGFLMMKNVVLSTVTSSGLVFMFGPTALRCQSILDPPVQKPSANPLASGGLAPQVLPGRGDNPAGSDPNGRSVAAWPQEFVYGLFGGDAWNAGQNPAQYLPNIDLFGNVTWDLWTASPNWTIPQVLGGLAFTDARNSPLNWKGMNYLTVRSSPGVEDVGEVASASSAVAEFYDRAEVRDVTQSWQDVSISSNVAANDKPLQWSTTGTSGAFASLGSTIGFDLTPGVNHKASPTDSKFGNDDCFVVPDGPPADLGVNGSGLSSDQQAVLTSFEQEVQDAIDAFNASQAPIISAALAALSAADTAQNSAFNDAFTDFEFWFSNNDEMNAALNAAFPDLATFGGPSIILNDIPDQGIINGIIGDGTLAGYFTVLNAANTAQTAAFAAFEAAVNAQAPLPPAPPGLNTNIAGFDFKTVSVSGGNWSIG